MSHRATSLQIAGISVAVGVLVGGALTALAMNSSSTSGVINSSAASMDDGYMMDEGMQSMGMSPADEADYMIDMIPHHQEAIDNAKLLVDYSNRPEMRDFGALIIKTQSAEIKQMQEWLREWYPNKDTRSDYQPMMGDLTALRGNQLDERFLETMIPHHMMAVMMSQQLVRGDVAKHEEVVPFAKNIRDVQRDEIYQMRQWLTNWFDGSYEHGPGMGGAHHMMGSTSSA